MIRVVMEDSLDRQRLRTVDVDGVATRVYDDGDGEPFLLVHGGAFGSLYSLDAWSLNLAPLAARFRVVAFDKLGQGHTGNPPGDAYTFPALFSHTVSLVRSLALGPAHVVGHSMGAFLAARLALECPELVRSLVLVDSNTLAPDDERFPWTAFYRELERRIPPGPPTPETVRIEPDAQSFSREHVTDDWVVRLLEIAELPKLQEAKARVVELRDTVWLPSLLPLRARTIEEIDDRGLPVPTLVVWGRDDVSAPLALALQLYERIAVRTADAELHVLGRAGHYCFREQPRAFERLVASFAGAC